MSERLECWRCKSIAKEAHWRTGKAEDGIGTKYTIMLCPVCTAYTVRLKDCSHEWHADKDNDCNVCIGGNDLHYGGSMRDREFSGWMDDVRIYNYALSPAEVGSLAGASNPGDLDGDGKVVLKDHAVLANGWLDEQLWP